MGKILGYLTTLGKIPLITALAVLGVGVGAALAMVVSNILTLGPTQLALAVSLTQEQGLPSTTAIGQENTVRFRIQTTQPVSGGVLYFHLRSPTAALADPTIAEVQYKGPGDPAFVVVPLVAAASPPGVLLAALKVGWAIPSGLNDTGEAKVVFKPNAPNVLYFVDLWVDGTLGTAPAPTATPPTGGGTGTQLFTLGSDRAPNRFTWISGTNADGSVPAASDGNVNTTGDTDNINGWPLKVHAAQAVQITFNGFGTTMHNMSVYPPTDECLGGYCATQLANSGDVTTGATVVMPAFTWATAGNTLYLVCNEHPGTMRTTVNVVP